MANNRNPADRLENQIEGKNPVIEALHSERKIEKIFISRGPRDNRISEIVSMASQKGIEIEELDKKKLDSLAASSAHQGVIALIAPYNYASVDDILKRAESAGEPPFIIILDEITDPHNFGAIVRSAECCGVHGIIIPKRRSASVTPVVAKASAGAVEHMLISKVTNIADTLEYLKKHGLWIAGADMDGILYTKQDLNGPIGIVIGSEGQGIRRLVRDKCDFLISIPMKGKIQSLNASVAAGILMYEVVRQRG
mgnify:CR=1 FL=1